MEIENFEGDLFWNADDTENTVYDPDDELDNIGDLGAIVEFEQAKRLPSFYGVLVAEGKTRYFDTRQEAEACPLEKNNG